MPNYIRISYVVLALSQKECKVERHNRTPIAYKIKREHIHFIKDEINKNKTITLHELNQKLKDKYKDVNLSTTQIFRVINDNNITLKLTRIRHEPVKRFGKDININSKIKEFYDEVKKIQNRRYYLY